MGIAGEVRKSIVGDFRAIAGVFMVERCELWLLSCCFFCRCRCVV